MLQNAIWYEIYLRVSHILPTYLVGLKANETTKKSEKWKIFSNHSVHPQIRNFTGREDFFAGWRELEEWFWGFEPFSKLFQQLSVNTEHQLKSKLTWSVWPKSMKLKQKWRRRNDYNQKCCFYWVLTWKLFLVGGGIKIWLEEFF